MRVRYQREVREDGLRESWYCTSDESSGCIFHEGRSLAVQTSSSGVRSLQSEKEIGRKGKI